MIIIIIVQMLLSIFPVLSACPVLTAFLLSMMLVDDVAFSDPVWEDFQPYSRRPDCCIKIRLGLLIQYVEKVKGGINTELLIAHQCS